VSHSRSCLCQRCLKRLPSATVQLVFFEPERRPACSGHSLSRATRRERSAASSDSMSSQDFAGRMRTRRPPDPPGPRVRCGTRQGRCNGSFAARKGRTTPGPFAPGAPPSVFGSRVRTTTSGADGGPMRVLRARYGWRRGPRHLARPNTRDALQPQRLPLAQAIRRTDGARGPALTADRESARHRDRCRAQVEPAEIDASEELCGEITGSHQGGPLEIRTRVGSLRVDIEVL
jgi:hypothetical protein